MVAALYSSRLDGRKKFRNIGKDVIFGWEPIVSIYNSDMCRAKQGVSRRVPGLCYAHVVRDSWTRLNVLPAKIMQVNDVHIIFKAWHPLGNFCSRQQLCNSCNQVVTRM